MLGDCTTTSAYERNTKVIQSSYISKVNEPQSQPASAKLGNPFGARSFWWFKLLFLSDTSVHFLLHPLHLLRFAHTVAVMRQRSEALLRKCNRRHSLNARASHARQAVFAFLPSPLHFWGVSHWKRVFCGWRFHFFRKPIIFLLFSDLGVKAAIFTSACAVGGRRHDKNGGAKCPSPRRCGGWRQRTEKHTPLPSPTTRCTTIDYKDF